MQKVRGKKENETQIPLHNFSASHDSNLIETGKRWRYFENSGIHKNSEDMVVRSGIG